MEDRHHVHHVGHLHGADEGIVVGEDVAVADARVLLVAVADHPFDEAAHRVDMHHDAVGERDRVAFRRVDGDDHLADLAHAGRGRDAAGHFARRDAIGAQLGVQRLEFQRILVAQRELGDAVIAAGLFHQPFGFEQPFAEAQRRRRVCPAWRSPFSSVGVVQQRPFIDMDTVLRMNDERGGGMFDDGRADHLMAGLQQVHLVEIGLVPAPADIGLAHALVGGTPDPTCRAGA